MATFDHPTDSMADPIDELRQRAEAGARKVGQSGSDLVAHIKPRLRGVIHQWSAPVALVLAIILVVAAPSGKAALAASIYGFTLFGLLLTSALYHRIDWPEQRRRWMRRLDHSMIFLLIAGTYTPFGLLVFKGGIGTTLLIVVWAGALAGVALSMAWPDAPKWVAAGVYIALGWVAVVGMPQMLEHAGIAAVSLVAAGGLLYTVGGVIYALQRPNPWPAVFGYHEIFHVLVVVAAAVQYCAIAFFVLPS